MNWQVFGIIGYLGVALGVVAAVLWLVHWMRPNRWLPYIALGLAVASLACARLNSNLHVARIDIDPSIMLNKMEEERKKKEQALLNSRTDEVYDVSFAEDASGESFDTAGMDDVDLKYLKAINESENPEWKKNKKSRGENAEEDDSLENAIGAKTKTEGADVAALEDEQGPEPILMNEASMVLAGQLDFWNLQTTQWMLVVAVLIVLLDYLRRANLYHEALKPVPLPSSLLQAFTPLPVIFHQPVAARRDVVSQLEWFTRRGDQWVYFTDRPDQTKDIKSSLAKLKRWPYRLDLIEVDQRTDNDFVLESAWYGRASFVCTSLDRSIQLLSHCLSQLKHRRVTQARARQYVHLVWDCDQELSPEALAAFEERAAVSAVSLYIIPPQP